MPFKYLRDDGKWQLEFRGVVLVEDKYLEINKLGLDIILRGEKRKISMTDLKISKMLPVYILCTKYIILIVHF